MNRKEAALEQGVGVLQRRIKQSSEEACVSHPRLFPQLNPNLKYQYEWEYQLRSAFYWVPMRKAG